MMKVKVAIFASGAGSNAGAILEYFKGSPDVEVSLVVTNNPNAGVIGVAEDFGLTEENKGLWKIENKDLKDPEKMSGLALDLKDEGIKIIACAGFMRILPGSLINEFSQENRVILNLHPSTQEEDDGHKIDNILDRTFERGGVHGIKIHEVIREVDKGRVLGHHFFLVNPAWTKEELMEAIHEIEHLLYPLVVRDTANEMR